MAVMTSHLPSLDVSSDALSPSPSSVQLRSLDSLLANSSAAPDNSMPRAAARPVVVQPLPLLPTEIAKSRANSISASRPSPRFHVTNPTERLSSLPAAKSGSMSKVTLPIGPHSGRTTPVSPPSPSAAAIMRPPVRPLPKTPASSLPAPIPLSPNRVPSKPRSRTSSAIRSRPQLSFDPTSSSYVIKTASEVNSHISVPPPPRPRLQTHARSRSAQFKNFASMVLPDVSDIRDPPSSAFILSERPPSAAKWKGKQAVRSAPTSDSEDTSHSRSRPSKTKTRTRRLVLHNPTESPPRPAVHSAPASDDEDSAPSSPSSPISSTTTLISPLLLPPTGSIKDMLPPIKTDFSQPTPTTPPSRIGSLHINTTRQTPPPSVITSASTSTAFSPPPSLAQVLALDIGYAEKGYVDDVRVYVDDGYDGPGGLGAFSTSVDPDVDRDIGEMVFNTRPPSGELMGPSVMDLDMEGRGRKQRGGHEPKDRDREGGEHAARWKSAGPSRTDPGREPGTSSGSGGPRGGRSASQSQNVGLSSLNAHMRSVPLPLPLPPVPQVELGPTPINMDLEPEMVFSQNPNSGSLTPIDSGSVPGVLDMEERMLARGKWRWRSPSPSPSPITPNSENLRNMQRYPTFAPVRSRGFYEDW